MKVSVLLPVLLAVILVSGCAFHKAKPAAAPKGASMIVTPDTSLAATVVSYNPTGRFVVLNFPPGEMPKMNQVLFLYRGGLKSGEVKITGPQNDSYIVADLIAGDAQVGDEVRNQ
jgi:hypothetical protein